MEQVAVHPPTGSDRSAFRYQVGYLAFLICATIVFISAANEQGHLRYAKYLIPAVAAYFLCFLKSPILRIPSFLLPFIALLFIGSLHFVKINGDGLKDYFFILAGASFFLVDFKNRRLNISRVNIAFMIMVAIFQLGNINWAARGVSLTESTSFVKQENNLSTLFGMFGVVACLRGQYALLILNVAFMVISMKRIALAALLLVFVVSRLPKRAQDLVLGPIPMLSMNFLFLGLVFCFSDRTFDPLLRNAFGMHTSWLIQGRDAFYKGVVADIRERPIAIAALGAGPGQAYTTAMASFGEHVNLHSDVLKIFYEYGLPGFVLFFMLLYRRQDRHAKLLALYYNVSLVIDNVLIFSHVLFIYFLLSEAIGLRKYHERKVGL